MLAASIWSLLLPALESAKNGSFATFSFLPAAVGLLFGGLFLWLLDKFSKYIKSRKDPLSSNLSKAAKLFIAMTVHNIPEGLAVGFAFGGIQSGNSVSAALGLAIGMAVKRSFSDAILCFSCQRRFSNRSGFDFKMEQYLQKKCCN